MNRQDEINEFVAMLNALCKKYEVQLGVSVNDVKPKEPTNSDKELSDAEIVNEPDNTTSK